MKFTPAHISLTTLVVFFVFLYARVCAFIIYKRKNPKFETRNPKQTRISKIQITEAFQILKIKIFEFVSIFDIRYSNLQKGVVTALFVLALGVISVAVFPPTTFAATGINRTINFQGKLVNTDGTNVADNTYSVIFRFYDMTSGGTALWSETQSVTTSDGIFRVALGSSTAIPANFNFNWDGLYLAMKVGSDSEMTPRIRMSAVPYAFNAEKVAGLTVQDENGVASTSGTIKVPNGKTISFGTNDLTFTTTATTTLSFGGSGGLTLVDTTSNQTLTNKTLTDNVNSFADNGDATKLLKFDVANVGSGTTLTLAIPSSPGTSDTICLETKANCSGGFSAGYFIQENGNGVATGGYTALGNLTTDFFVGGISTQAAKFAVLNVNNGTPTASVAGNMSLGATSGTTRTIGATQMNALQLGDATTGDLRFAPANSLAMTLKANGNVGIGDSTPASLFSVGSGDLFQIDSSGRAFLPSGALGSGTLSLAFTGDPNTGLYNSAADTMNLVLGGVNGLVLNPTGSATSWFTMTQSSSDTTGPLFSVDGAGSDIDLRIQAKGSGKLKLGSGTGNISILPGANNAIVNLASTGDFLIQDNGTTFAIFDDTGNVGIGDTTPDAKFDIDFSSTSSTGATEYGSYLTISDTGNVSSGTDTTYGQYIDLTRTGASGGTIGGVGQYINVTGDTNISSLGGSSINVSVAGGTTSNNIYGSSINVDGGNSTGLSITAYTDVNGSNAVGTYIDVSSTNGSGTVTAINGGTFKASLGDAGGVTSVSALGTAVNNFSTGTLQFGYGLLIASATNGGGGSFLNNYGIYIQDQSAVGSTNSYNLYSAGASSKNYFAGNVGIGQTNPSSYNLDVTGTARFTGAITVASCTGCGGGGNDFLIQTTGNGVATGGYTAVGNLTTDFFVGGISTQAAKFAVLNVNNGTPVASVAGNISLGGASGTTRTIGASQMNALQLGDATTGDLLFAPNNSLAMTLKANGNVGIGDTTPDAMFDIDFSSSSGTAGTEYGSYLTISDTGNVSSGTDTTYGQYISLTRTGASGTADLSSYGQYISMTGDLGGTLNRLRGSYITASGGDYAIGSDISVSTPANALTYTGLNGITIDANHQASTTLSSSIGIESRVRQQDGTVSTAKAGHFQVSTTDGTTDNAYAGYFLINADGNITTAYGVHVEPATVDAGSIGTAYGVHIGDQSSGGATTHYNVYSEGTSSKNYFAGLVGVGTDTVPDAQFEVEDSAARAIDLVSLVSSGATVTDGVDGLQIDYTQGDNANASQTNSAINVNVTGNSDDADGLNGINIANLAGSSGNASSTAIKIGTGWDVGLAIASGGITISGGTFAYSGSARPTRTFTISPEYAGSIITAYNGSSTDTNITGSLTSDIETTSNNRRTYYQWTRTTDATQHYYTVAVRAQLPDNFSAWSTSNAITVDYTTSSATSGVTLLDVRIVDESGNNVVTASTNNTSTSWTTVSFGSANISNWTAAGQRAVIYLRMGAASSGTVKISDIKLSYLASF